MAAHRPSLDYVDYTCSDVESVMNNLYNEIIATIASYSDSDLADDASLEVRRLVNDAFTGVKKNGTELMRDGFDRAMLDWVNEKDGLTDEIADLKYEIRELESKIEELESRTSD